MIVDHTPNIPLSQILFTNHKQKIPLGTPSHFLFNNDMIFWKWLQSCQVDCIYSSSIQLYTFLTTVINFQFHNNEETLHPLKNCDFLCKILHPHLCQFISNQIFLTNTHTRSHCISYISHKLVITNILTRFQIPLLFHKEGSFHQLNFVCWWSNFPCQLHCWALLHFFQFLIWEHFIMGNF